MKTFCMKIKRAKTDLTEVYDEKTKGKFLTKNGGSAAIRGVDGGHGIECGADGGAG